MSNALRFRIKIWLNEQTKKCPWIHERLIKLAIKFGVQPLRAERMSHAGQDATHYLAGKYRNVANLPSGVTSLLDSLRLLFPERKAK